MSEPGGGMDAGRMAQINASSQAGPAPEKPKNLDEFITALLEMPSRWLSKAVGVRLDSFMNTGLFANMDITKAGIQVNNQMLKQNFDVQGGALANILADGTQIASIKDFSRIQMPDISGLGVGPPESISMASLGDLRPDPTPAGGISRGGMDMMA